MYSLAIRMAAVTPSDVYLQNVTILAATSRNVEAASSLVEAWAQVPSGNASSATNRIAAAGIFLRSLYALALNCPTMWWGPTGLVKTWRPHSNTIIDFARRTGSQEDSELRRFSIPPLEECTEDSCEGLVPGRAKLYGGPYPSLTTYVHRTVSVQKENRSRRKHLGWWRRGKRFSDTVSTV